MNGLLISYVCEKYYSNKLSQFETKSLNMRRFLRIMVLEYQESLKDWNADDFFNYEFIRQKDGGREERGIMNDELREKN